MKNKILIVITFLAGTLLFNSCLKDKLNTDWTPVLSGKMYAEFPYYGLQSFTINNLPADQQVRVFVNLATDAVPASDVTVTFKVDAADLAAYNAQAKLDYIAAHSADPDYNINKFVPLIMCPGVVTPAPLVIKAGNRNAYEYITLKRADTLRLTVPYAIPVTITTVSNGGIIAANKQTVILQVPVANKWEGSYNLSYFVLRAGDPVLSGSQRNMPWKLSTSGAKSVIYYKTHYWGDGKGVVGGIGPFKLDIDESVVPNPVTVTSPPTGDNPGNATLKNRAGYNCRYDPTTKTFYIGVTWSTPGTREATDTLVYTGKF